MAGVVDCDLAAIEPAPPCVSRWKTLWSIIFRLYVGTSRTIYELKNYSNYNVQCSNIDFYQVAPLCNTRPKESFPVPANMKQLNNKEKAILKRTDQRNRFFAHTVQLFGMCADENLNVREIAVSIT